MRRNDDAAAESLEITDEAPKRPERGGRKAGENGRGGTTRAGLAGTIKSVRDKLRQDAGLSGDTDRLPQLTWLLFLKWLDDFEQSQETVYGDEHEPILESPFRWRDWAGEGDAAGRMTGDELKEFVNARLIPHLRLLSGVDVRDIRTVVGTIFQGTDNRIRSGYILREVVDKLNTIDFNASDDIHTVSLFYETMLLEMRNAAGDSGEFYTPRAVVRFIIDRLHLQPGDRVLDPACGTGGFLAEAFERLKPAAGTPDQREALWEGLHGIEKKPLPYLLGVMNLLLHNIERPNLEERNALGTPLAGIREADRVDVVVTNPPFGGEEEPGIQSNFPQGMRTKETTILFFQYVMAMLKKPNGRCGIVLPNGFLFGTGVAASVKQRLLERFNLHTIVRLPNGVFAPYTSIPTNLLFFDACAPGEEPCTKEVWYYEQPLPEGRKQYTKTAPLQFKEFADCIAWWSNREENERAWRVPVQQILENGCNLDVKNPRAKDDLEHLPPEQLVEEIMLKEQRILEIMGEIRGLLAAGPGQ